MEVFDNAMLSNINYVLSENFKPNSEKKMSFNIFRGTKNQLLLNPVDISIITIVD